MVLTRVVGLFALTMCFVPVAVAHAITFPITLTDYWPAMDAGWKLEAEGCPACFGQFVRTGPRHVRLEDDVARARRGGPARCGQALRPRSH